jgi:CRISPR/Cas system-associated exonuclease Cas4 (RecB family)
MGIVIHRSLEILLTCFREHGCDSSADPSAVAALRELGGYSQLIATSIDEVLSDLRSNPRVTDRINFLSTSLRARVPELRHDVQAIVSRINFKSGDSHDGSHRGEHLRERLLPGSYVEIELHANELRIMGRIDLLTIKDGECEIRDFKSGDVEAGHAEQLRFYALIWTRETELNPLNVPVSRMVLSYPSHDIEIIPPNSQDFEELALVTTNRISNVELQLGRKSPNAVPSPTACRFCNVRQLCNEYWAALDHKLAGELAAVNPEWFDVEGSIEVRNGARSWFVTKANTRTRFLLRTTSEWKTFKPGDHVRFINLRRETDPEVDCEIGVMTQSSESFLLTESITNPSPNRRVSEPEHRGERAD